METWRTFCFPVSGGRIKKNDRSTGKNVEQLEFPRVAGGSAKHFNHSGKESGSL